MRFAVNAGCSRRLAIRLMIEGLIGMRMYVSIKAEASGEMVVMVAGDRKGSFPNQLRLLCPAACVGCGYFADWA